MSLTQRILADRGGRWLLAVLGIAIVIVPTANLVLPETSFLHIPTYTVTLLGKYLSFALLAVALDLV